MNYIACSGNSEYRIRFDRSAGVSTLYAVEELQSCIARMTGVQIPVVSSNEYPQKKEILIGSAYPDVDVRDLSPEQYILKTENSGLIITGGEPRGILYGVYALLSNHWGCRWFAPDAEHIPEYKELPLPDLDETYTPPFEQREVYMYDAFDGDWMARNRLNGTGGRGRAAERWEVTSSVPWLSEKHGGTVRFGKDFFVHTFSTLVPPRKYFAEHPEYYALVDGKRITDQLCCTNENVIRICSEAVIKGMDENPEATVFSCSQNDNYNYCQCEECLAFAESEGSQMGPVLNLVNRVAEQTSARYPDNIVETLAYQWTRKPPKNIKPHRSVVIRLCSIECCLSHAFTSGCSGKNDDFAADLKKWAEISDRLWIWDYIISFAHYLLPFPNKRCMRDNILFFADNHVTGILQQGAWNTPESEFSAMQAYVRAQLLYNPGLNQEQLISEFLQGYYGAAAGFVQRYLDLLHDSTDNGQIHCTCECQPFAGHLTSLFLVEADVIWEEAETAVRSSPEILDRIRRTRMSLDYAIMDRAGDAMEHHEHPDPKLLRLAAERKEQFIVNLRKSSLRRINQFGEPGLKREYIRKLNLMDFSLS